MGSKRPFSEVNSMPTGKDAPEYHDAPENGPPAKKKKKGKKSHKAREGTINWVKKRARNIKRRFERDQELPATVRRELELELETLEERIDEEVFKKKRNGMIKRYHMVRFFERQKASRLSRQLQTKLEETEDPEEQERLKNEIHVAEVDVAYTKYFPFMERYVSLYPGSKEEKEVTAKDPTTTPRALRALQTERPKLWPTIEKTMKQGRPALEKIRDRRLEIDSHAKPAPERPSKHSFTAKVNTFGKKGQLPEKKDRRQKNDGGYWQDVQEEEDDGEGFFE